MARRIQSNTYGSVRVVDDALPVVHMLTNIDRLPTRSESLLRITRKGAARILPVSPGAVAVGARAFTPCDYAGTPLRDPPPAPSGIGPVPTVGPLAPPVTLDVVALDTLPVGSTVLAPVNLATSGAWDRGTIVGDTTHVRSELVGSSLQQSIALGRRVTWLPISDLQGPAGVAMFAGGRAAGGSGFYGRPAVTLDAYLPSGKVQLRGADGTTFVTPAFVTLASIELPLPEQAARVWIIEEADAATTDPAPVVGAPFACVHPSFNP